MPDRSEILGSYLFTSRKWESQLILHEDGTFQQKVVNRIGGERFAVDGKWTKLNRAVDFSSFLGLFDPSTFQSLEVPRETFSLPGAIDGNYLVISKAANFVFKKERAAR